MSGPYQYPIKFGKYLLTRRLAVGGMAEVFKAKLVGIKGFEKTLAVKRILPEFNEDEDFVQMFVDEARISSHLHHGNIVQVYDFGQVDGWYFIAMEFLDGPNLKSLAQRVLKQTNSFPRSLALYTLLEIARALEYAHTVKVEGVAVLDLVHRDVSPQNILVSRRGEVKITDFGIAKATIKLSRTQPGKVQGKFSYMSPEQASGKAIDRRSDIFSLGIIAYELLSGLKLYGAEDTHQRYRDVRDARMPRLGEMVPDLPAQLESLVMRMLEKNPNDRPQTCADVVRELTEIVGNISQGDLPAKLGALVDELFPAEKSDSNAARKWISVEGSPRDAQEADPQAPESNTQAIKATDATTIEPTLRTGPGFLLWLILVAFGAAAGTYGIYRYWKSTDTPAPPPLASTPIPNVGPGPVDSDLRAEAEARESELEARLARLEEQLKRSEEQASETRQSLAKTEEKLRDAAIPAPPPKRPPCPDNMVLIRNGKFIYGSDLNDPDRNPLVESEARPLSLQRFCIDRYEFPNEKGVPPKTNTSWSDSLARCSGEGKHLCTQEEWERACKGPSPDGKNRRFPYGDKFDATSCNTEKRAIATAGSFPDCRSPEGVFDMSGNVDEWTASAGRFSRDTHVSRGGSVNRSRWANRCTSLRLIVDSATEPDVGFRCCKDAF